MTLIGYDEKSAIRNYSLFFDWRIRLGTEKKWDNASFSSNYSKLNDQVIDDKRKPLIIDEIISEADV